MPFLRHSSQATSVSRAGRMHKNSDVFRFRVTLKLRESHICPEDFLMREKRVFGFGAVFSPSWEAHCLATLNLEG